MSPVTKTTSSGLLIALLSGVSAAAISALPFGLLTWFPPAPFTSSLRERGLR
jgi:hypothetical protein